MFTIQSIVMAQKLKGTLSFIAKVRGWVPQGSVMHPSSKALPCTSSPCAPSPCTPSFCTPSAPQNDEGSTHEKLDFKLHFTCTSYLVTTPCYRCATLPPAPSSLLSYRGGLQIVVSMTFSDLRRGCVRSVR